MHIGRPDLDIFEQKLSDNVAHMDIARRTGPGPIYPKFKVKENKKCNEVLMNHPDGSPTKHGEVGGPNSPKNVFDWMVKSAREAGVKLKGNDE